MGEEFITKDTKLVLSDKEKEKYKDFLKEKRTLKDFDIGLTIPSKLIPRNIKGGVILDETDFTMRDFM